MKLPAPTSVLVMAACMFPVHALHAKGGDDAGWSFGTAGGDKCRLSSPKVTMFDGYQQNTIQLHVTPTGLYLQSKAPIDASQADTGLQVEADSPEDRAQLRAAEADLKEFASFASLDIEALQAEIGLVEEERDRVRNHKWFQDYTRNPINAARLDSELAAAERKLEPLMQKRRGAQAYLEARQGKQKALDQLAQLPAFPLTLSSELEMRKKLHFTQQRDDMIAAFQRGATIRVQLRFWPTWPETGTHEARLTLGGFNETLAQFQACAGQG